MFLLLWFPHLEVLLHEDFWSMFATCAKLFVCVDFPALYLPLTGERLCLCVVPVPNRPTTPLTAGALVPPPRPSSRPKLPTGKLTGINEIVSCYHHLCAAALISAPSL